jgi:hypothetical protein
MKPTPTTPSKSVRAVRSRILAEVWDRYLLQVPGSDPVSRHRSVEAAQRACARLNHAMSDPDGSYPSGRPPYVVYARLPDRHEFVELVSWKAGTRPSDDTSPIFSATYFASREEAVCWGACLAVQRKWMRKKVGKFDPVVAIVYPSSQPVTHRWHYLTARAVPLVLHPAQDAHSRTPGGPQGLPSPSPRVNSPEVR